MKPQPTEAPTLHIGDTIACPGIESATVETVLLGGVFGVRLPDGSSTAIRNDATVRLVARADAKSPVIGKVSSTRF